MALGDRVVIAIGRPPHHRLSTRPGLPALINGHPGAVTHPGGGE